MKRFPLLPFALTLLGCCCPAAVRADLHPEKLAPFRLGRSAAPLRGFTQERPGSRRVAPLFEAPPGAAAALNARFFRGPSELGYSVLLFPTRRALADWERRMRSSAPGWPAPPPRRRRARATVVVNRVLITVHAYQHAEMARRRPRLARHALADGELAKRMDAVKAELVRRAKALPENR